MLFLYFPTYSESKDNWEKNVIFLFGKCLRNEYAFKVSFQLLEEKNRRWLE